MQGYGKDKIVIIQNSAMIQTIAKNILDLEGIVGIGYGSRVKIYVESEDYLDVVPRVLGGKPVEAKVVGRIYALSYLATLATSSITPLVGGISISNDSCMCSGTLGVIHEGIMYSNAHVFAMDAEGYFVDSANIIQPGVADEGERVVGYLKSYVDIKFNDLTAENYYDIAYAIPTIEYEEDFVLGVEPYEIQFEQAKVRSGDVVRKTGRTTGTTYGVIDSTDTSIKVFYSNEKWAVFHNIISVLTEGFCAAGDSGSLVDKDGKVVGLLFAGTEKGYGFVCRILELDVEPVRGSELVTGVIGLANLLRPSKWVTGVIGLAGLISRLRV